MPSPLDEYNRKRAERESEEPKDETPWGPSRGPVKQFAIHQRTVHGGKAQEELRFEQDGVARTFLFPAGLDFVRPGNRVAVQLDDHPYEWIDWAGGEIKFPDGAQHTVRCVVRGELELLMENPGAKFVIRIFGAGLYEGTLTFNRNFKRKSRREWFVSRRTVRPDCIDPVATARRNRA